MSAQLALHEFISLQRPALSCCAIMCAFLALLDLISRCFPSLALLQVARTCLVFVTVWPLAHMAARFALHSLQSGGAICKQAQPPTNNRENNATDRQSQLKALPGEESLAAADCSAGTAKHSSRQVAHCSKGKLQSLIDTLIKTEGMAVEARMSEAPPDPSSKVYRAELGMLETICRGVKPTHKSFTHLIGSFAKTPSRQHAAKALHWFEQIHVLGLTPNVIDFCSVINAHAKANDVSGAIDLLDKMEESGMAASIYAYAHVLDACARVNGHRNIAVQIFGRMKAKGIRPNILTYTALARNSSDIGDYLEVERLRAEMQREGIRMNRFFFSVLLWSYANAMPPQAGRARAQFCNEAPYVDTKGCELYVFKALGASVGVAVAQDLFPLLRRDT